MAAKLHVLLVEGAEGVPQHAAGDLLHFEDDVLLGRGFFLQEVVEARLGHVHGLVADPFQVGVDLHDGGEEAQVPRHRLVQGEELDAAVVHFDVEPVHLFLQLEDFLRRGGVPFPQGLGGFLDHGHGRLTHVEQARFQNFQVFVEVAFHRFSRTAR